MGEFGEGTVHTVRELIAFLPLSLLSLSLFLPFFSFLFFLSFSLSLFFFLSFLPSFLPPPLFLSFLLSFFFLGLHLWHMGNPRLGVIPELQLPAYTTAAATWDPSCVCDPHHSSWQDKILNPLSKARYPPCVLMDTSQVLNPLSYSGNSYMHYFYLINSNRSYLTRKNIFLYFMHFPIPYKGKKIYCQEFSSWHSGNKLD